MVQSYQSNKKGKSSYQENLDFNNNRIETANSESELWEVANDVIKPYNSIYVTDGIVMDNDH